MGLGLGRMGDGYALGLVCLLCDIECFCTLCTLRGEFK